MNDHISKLHVANIGIFNNLDIEFSPDINIIIGSNSTGKTSILKCITFCFSQRNLEFTRFRKGASFGVDFTHNDQLLRAGVDSIVNTDQEYRTFKAANWGSVSTKGVSATFLPLSDVPYNMLAIGAHRYFDYKKIDGMKGEAKGVKRKEFYDNNNLSFLEKPSLPDVKQWMINRYFIIEKDWAKIECANWHRVMSFLPEIVPASQKFKFERIERDLEPKFSLNNNVCYLEELSGGFKSILSVIFSIIDWCEGVNEGEMGLIEHAQGTVLIDEIDAHLHPEWQGIVVQNLRKLFPEIQFILTTHSPHIIASAEENQIIKIPTHDGTLNLKPISRTYEGWQLSDILADLMGVVEPNELQARPLLDNIDNAIQEKNQDKFEQELVKLRRVLHASDPILKVYEIKRSNIFL